MSDASASPAGISAEPQRAPVRGLGRSLPFLAALLPIVLLSLFSYRTAENAVQTAVREQNTSAVANVSQLLTQDFKRISDIAVAVASVPGTVEALSARDDIAMLARLRAVVLAYPQIDRVFVVDAAGTTWVDYPQAPGALGVDRTDIDVRDGNPRLSNAYVRPHESEVPVAAIAAPITNGDGAYVGAMVFEYRTGMIRRWLQDIVVGDAGFVFILDGEGNVVAHPDIEPEGVIRTDYAADPALREVRETGRVIDGELIDPRTNERVIASVRPVVIAGNAWTVVARQPIASAYAPLRRVRFNVSLAGGVLSLVTLCTVIALALAMRRNERLNAALEAKNSTLRDITSFVSHQLRAPVTAMRWSIEEIMDGDTGPIADKTKESLQELHDVAIQNGKLIDDILNVSRIDRGVIEVKTESTQLRDVADRALRDYRTAIEKAGLSLTLKGMESDILVLVDKEKMAESVTNAISNAIKHTKSGGITISIRKDDRFGYVDVIDTGEGMEPDIMSRLFDRAGVKGSNTAAAASTGLGLFIARNFMRLQKGDITVASQPGKGSTFTYAIPLASASN